MCKINSEALLLSFFPRLTLAAATFLARSSWDSVMIRFPLIFLIFFPIYQYRVAVLGGGDVTFLGLEINTEFVFT